MDGWEEWDLNVNKLMQYNGKEKDFEIRHIWVEDPTSSTYCNITASSFSFLIYKIRLIK